MASKGKTKFTKAELNLLSNAQPAGKHHCVVLLHLKADREAAKSLSSRRLGNGVRGAVVGFQKGEPSAFALVGQPRKQFLMLESVANGLRLGWDIGAKRPTSKGKG